MCVFLRGRFTITDLLGIYKVNKKKKETKPNSQNL